MKIRYEKVKPDGEIKEHLFIVPDKNTKGVVMFIELMRELNTNGERVETSKEDVSKEETTEEVYYNEETGEVNDDVEL